MSVTGLYNFYLPDNHVAFEKGLKGRVSLLQLSDIIERLLQLLDPADSSMAS